MRRIVNSDDNKITYIEFAKLIRPVDLGLYLKRIRKRTKQEDKYAEDHQNALVMDQMAEKKAALRKPLTAFKKSEVMLNKNPDRHVRLMPVEFEYTGQFSAGPTQMTSNRQVTSANRQFDSTQNISSFDKFGFQKNEKQSADFGGGIEDFFE